MFAPLINASILILAAAAFHGTRRCEVAELGEAHGLLASLLASLLGSAFASTLFGIALLCCGLNSTVTAMPAGQAAMEGFLGIRLPPRVRRLIPRLVAIVPAAVVTVWYGEEGTPAGLPAASMIVSFGIRPSSAVAPGRLPGSRRSLRPPATGGSRPKCGTACGPP